MDKYRNTVIQIKNRYKLPKREAAYARRALLRFSRPSPLAVRESVESPAAKDSLDKRDDNGRWTLARGAVVVGLSIYPRRKNKKEIRPLLCLFNNPTARC